MRKLLALIDLTNTWIGKVVGFLSLVVAFIISYEMMKATTSDRMYTPTLPSPGVC